jgi:hypothetical protein
VDKLQADVLSENLHNVNQKKHGFNSRSLLSTYASGVICEAAATFQKQNPCLHYKQIMIYALRRFWSPTGQMAREIISPESPVTAGH